MKAFLNSKLISLSVVVLAFGVAAAVAKADVITQTVTVPTSGLTQTDFSGLTGTASQFDTSLGTLQSVTIQFTGSGTTDITATANNANSPTVFSALFTNLTLALTDPADPAVNALTEDLTGGPNVSNLNKLTVVSGTPYNSGADTMSGTAASQTLTSNLTSFEGLGTVTFDLAGGASTTESFSGGNFTAGQTTDADGIVVISYDYIPNSNNVTPEPGTLVLFGSGLLGLAGLVRRKFQQSR